MIPSKRTNPTTTKITSDNVTAEDQSHIAEIFNRYFVEIGQSLAQNANTLDSTDFKSFLKNSVFDSIVLNPPQPNEIYNVINTLNTHKACGYDNISSYFLCLGNEALAPFLSQYFGYFLKLGTFPGCFKVAEVIPIFKSGKKHQVNIQQLSPHISPSVFIQNF